MNRYKLSEVFVTGIDLWPNVNRIGYLSTDGYSSHETIEAEKTFVIINGWTCMSLSFDPSAGVSVAAAARMSLRPLDGNTLNHFSMSSNTAKTRRSSSTLRPSEQN